jgi:hypothetical protein
MMGVKLTRRAWIIGRSTSGTVGWRQSLAACRSFSSCSSTIR